MATYTATDLIDKTIYITGNVPVYKYAARAGEKKTLPIKILQSGDSFIVDSFIKKNGTYVTYDDNYWTLKDGGVVSFSEIAGKYNTELIRSQGVKSDAEKELEKKTGIEKYIDKYGKWVLLAIAGVAIIKTVAKQ